jgi:hypothetical protein
MEPVMTKNHNIVTMRDLTKDDLVISEDGWSIHTDMNPPYASLVVTVKESVGETIKEMIPQDYPSRTFGEKSVIREFITIYGEKYNTKGNFKPETLQKKKEEIAAKLAAKVNEGGEARIQTYLTQFNAELRRRVENHNHSAIRQAVSYYTESSNPFDADWLPEGSDVIMKDNEELKKLNDEYVLLMKSVRENKKNRTALYHNVLRTAISDWPEVYKNAILAVIDKPTETKG